MAKPYDTVASNQDLRDYDDSNLPHGYPILVNDAEWYVLNRTSTAEDDDVGALDCASGNGRWLIAEPADYPSILQAKNSLNTDD